MVLFMNHNQFNPYMYQFQTLVDLLGVGDKEFMDINNIFEISCGVILAKIILKLLFKKDL